MNRNSLPNTKQEKRKKKEKEFKVWQQHKLADLTGFWRCEEIAGRLAAWQASRRSTHNSYVNSCYIDNELHSKGLYFFCFSFCFFFFFALANVAAYSFSIVCLLVQLCSSVRPFVCLFGSGKNNWKHVLKTVRMYFFAKKENSKRKNHFKKCFAKGMQLNRVNLHTLNKRVKNKQHR